MAIQSSLYIDDSNRFSSRDCDSIMRTHIRIRHYHHKELRLYLLCESALALLRYHVNCWLWRLLPSNPHGPHDWRIDLSLWHGELFSSRNLPRTTYWVQPQIVKGKDQFKLYLSITSTIINVRKRQTWIYTMQKQQKWSSKHWKWASCSRKSPLRHYLLSRLPNLT